MEKKFTAFRVFATFYKVASVIIALGTVLIVLLMIVGFGSSDRALRQVGIDNSPVVTFLIVIIVFIAGGLSAVGVYALGEAMYLLLAMEENTRFTSILLRDRFYPQPQAQQTVLPNIPQAVTPPPVV